MQFGRYRDRVTLQKRTVVNDGGAATPTYTAQAPERLPAVVESVSGERVERVFGSQVVPVATHTVTLRAGMAIDLADRLIWHTGDGDRALEVRGLATVGTMRRECVAACEERDV